MTLENLKILKLLADPEMFKNCSANAPFYIDLQKPRPSLSKHDVDKSTYWNYNDANYIVACVKYVEDQLKKE